MKNTATPCTLPELTTDFLRSRSCLVDNLFADLGCCVPCHYIPVRSWPLFRARELMHDLIQSFTQEINP